jgi:hypothetical protein
MLVHPLGQAGFSSGAEGQAGSAAHAAQLEIWHNRRRRHSALGWVSPLEFENGSKIVVAWESSGPTPGKPRAPQGLRTRRGDSSSILGDDLVENADRG